VSGKLRILHNYVKEETFDYENEKIKIEFLLNHYYLPVIMSEDDKEHYFMHIIKIKSEVQFLKELDEYFQKENNFFKQFDCWFFSKIDETLDEVYIPYYQPKTNRIEKFKPDFIFWLKKGNNYTLLFVDPKGTEHSDGYRKIDGYSKIFEKEINNQKQLKTFSNNGFSVNVKLFLKPKQGIANVLENYKQYWFDNFGDFDSKIKALAIVDEMR